MPVPPSRSLLYFIFQIAFKQGKYLEFNVYLRLIGGAE